MAQSKKNSSHFPSYEEVRGNKKEIIDFVALQTSSNDNQPVVKKTIQVDKYWNAFNYPAGSTVYSLHNKEVKNQKAAKKESDERSVDIERVSIGAVEPKGKHEVEIDYWVKTQN